MKSYGQVCALARALDVVGERWTMLMIRELIMGPKRFSDLERGLPGVSPSLLGERLQELQQAGVVERRELPPPAGSTVYELTEKGRALDDTLKALARWGARFGRAPTRRDVTHHAPGFMLHTFFDAEAARGLEASCNFRFQEYTASVRFQDGSMVMEQGRTSPADVTITVDRAAFVDMMLGRITVAAAMGRGALEIAGNVKLGKRVLRAFGA